MKFTLIRIITLVTVLSILSLSGIAADTKPKVTTQEEKRKMMAIWEEMATPGPEHAIIAKMAGKWDAKLTFNWSPDSKPMITKGTQTAEMIFGGRYLSVSNAANIAGMQTEGKMLLAFDKFKKEYELVWIDNMGTMMLTAHGTGSADGKTITMRGKMDEPMSGEKDKLVEFIFKFVDDDHYSKEMWDHPLQGPAFKAMEVEYTRSK